MIAQDLMELFDDVHNRSEAPLIQTLVCESQLKIDDIYLTLRFVKFLCFYK